MVDGMPVCPQNKYRIVFVRAIRHSYQLSPSADTLHEARFTRLTNRFHNLFSGQFFGFGSVAYARTVGG